MKILFMAADAHPNLKYLNDMVDCYFSWPSALDFLEIEDIMKDVLRDNSHDYVCGLAIDIKFLLAQPAAEIQDFRFGIFSPGEDAEDWLQRMLIALERDPARANS